MKRIIIVASVFIIAIFTTVTISLSRNNDYSDEISYEEAIEVIERLKYEAYSDSFDNWDIQKIDDEIKVVTYFENAEENTVITDINNSDHSWITLNSKVIYEIMDGDIVIGDDLSNDITSKLSHQVKTYGKEVSEETIEFETLEETNSRVPKGEKQLLTKGKNGVKEITVNNDYVDGQLVHEDISEKIVTEAINEVTLLGTFVEPPAPPKPKPKPSVPKVDNSKIKGKRSLTWYNAGWNENGTRAPWGSKSYGKYSFESTGCVPTSLAIALSGYNIHVNPGQVGDMLYNDGYFNTKYIGTGGSGVVHGAEKYGLGVRGLNSQSELSSALQNGSVVLAAVQTGKFGTVKGLTYMVVLNGYRDGSTYVIDPSYSSKSSNATVASLWNSRSFDPIDTEMGYVFFEMVGGGVNTRPEEKPEVDPTPPEDNKPDPVPPVEEPKPEEPKDIVIVENLMGLNKWDLEKILTKYGLEAKYNEKIIITNVIEDDGKTEVTNYKSTLPTGTKVMNIDINVYEYAEDETSDSENNNDPVEETE